MESETINTIEIDGKVIDLSKKMVEIPRQKKLFEKERTYENYLREVLREAFPFNEKLHTKEEYDYFIDYNICKLWEATDENKSSLKEKVSETFTNVKKNRQMKKLDKKEKKEKKKKEKTSILSKIIKPFKFIGKVILIPFKAVGNLIKKVNSKMPWSKKKESIIDNDKILDEAIEAAEQEIDNDKILEEAMKKEEIDRVQEAEEELKQNTNEELTKEMIERLNRQIEELKKENERLIQIKEQDEKENKILKNKIEIVKKQPERDKKWAEYFKEEQEKENVRNKIEAVEKDMDESILHPVETLEKYGSMVRIAPSLKLNKKGEIVRTKPSFEMTRINEENIKNACKQPYNIIKNDELISVSKDDVKDYRDSKIIEETEDTVTITGEYYNFLIKNEFDFRKEIVEEFLKAFPSERENIVSVKDYNNNGLISRNKGINERKVVYDISCTLTKERYNELEKVLDESIKRAADKHNQYYDLVENLEFEKKLKI